MRCPECGKELTKDEILIPLHDAENPCRMIGWFHVDYARHMKFLRSCERLGLDPIKIFLDFEEALLKEFKKKNGGQS